MGNKDKPVKQDLIRDITNLNNSTTNNELPKKFRSNLKNNKQNDTVINTSDEHSNQNSKTLENNQKENIVINKILQKYAKRNIKKSNINEFEDLNNLNLRHKKSSQNQETIDDLSSLG